MEGWSVAYVEWTDQYSVGVRELDAQHQKLFGLINEFYECVKDGKLAAGTAKVIHGLAEYAVFHFGFEEKLMRRCSYAGREAQEAAHKAFADTVADYKQRFESGKLVLTVEVSSFLKRWLTEHILESDKLYAQAMSSAGIT
jgi:hemerythrin-like metal-binding protein